MKTLYKRWPVFSVVAMIVGCIAQESASGQTFKSLYSFNQETTDGAEPLGQLVLSGNTLYGTASGGGTTGMGTVFRINIDGTGYQTLYNFTDASDFTNIDGGSPMGGLAISGGTLYGAAYDGGLAGNGTIFSLDTNGSDFITLFSFPPGPNNEEGQDGESPQAGLILAGNTLYGTALSGGSEGAGVVFSINTNGSSFSLVHDFQGPDGVFPMGDLTLSGNTLFGMTQVNNIFRVNTDGSGFASLLTLQANPDGSALEGTLAISGNTIYGAADLDGVSGNGTIFSVNTNGSGIELLHTFGGGNEGANPFGGVKSAGGVLYGTTQDLYSGYGTIFSFDSVSGFKTLHVFDESDGSAPEGPLLYSGGTLYGTTSSGGSTYAGTIFSLAVNYVQITATPTNGAAPLTVNFASASVDNNTNAVGGWSWDFGDGSSSTQRSPAHVYTVPGLYTPVLTVTNTAGVQIIDPGPSIKVTPSFGLVSNGGFETGDFTSWTLSGDTSFTFVDDGSWSGIMPFDGNDEAILGNESNPGYLSQRLTTAPGANYVLSFWFNNPYEDYGIFAVFWDGKSLLDTTSVYFNNWTNLQFNVSATQTSTVLQFGFFDYGYFGLDDVSVVPVQSSAPKISMVALSGSSLVIGGTGGQAGAKYTILSSADPGAPLKQWNPISTNTLVAGGNFLFTVTNAVTGNSRQQFYILRIP